MKSLVIFVFLAHQLLFFNLLSMEDKVIYENDLPEENQLTQSYPINTNQKNNNFGKYKSGNLNFDLKTIRFHQQNIDDTSLNEGDYFIGKLSSENAHLLNSFIKFPIIPNNIFPKLIKVIGPKYSGKTTFIRHIAKTINCTNSQYLEIGSLKSSDEIKKLQFRGINLKPLSSETKGGNAKIRRENIEEIIIGFYPSKVDNHPYIINFTKGLGLHDNVLEKLRKLIEQIQKEKTASLTVFYETKKDSYDFNFLDEVIHIFPPSPEDIKAMFVRIFMDNGYKYEEIRSQTISKLNPAACKKQYSYPYIKRLAEKIIRTTIIKNEQVITNDIIEQVVTNIH